jgi:hypothetical protein
MPDRLDEVLEILKRIEQRQIKTTAMVEGIEETETKPVGGFGTVEKEK